MRSFCTSLLKSPTLALSMVLSTCLSLASAEVVVIERARLVTDFTVFVPNNPVDCDSQSPWAAGRWKLSNGGAVPSGGCLSLSYKVISEAHTVMIHQGPEGELTRLAPSACILDQGAMLPQGEHWYPAPRYGRERIIGLDGEQGIERFHLIAFAAEGSTSILLQKLAAIPSFENNCQPVSTGVRDVETLNVLVEASDVLVEWQVRSIEHY